MVVTHLSASMVNFASAFPTFLIKIVLVEGYCEAEGEREKKNHKNHLLLSCWLCTLTGTEVKLIWSGKSRRARAPMAFTGTTNFSRSVRQTTS